MKIHDGLKMIRWSDDMAQGKTANEHYVPQAYLKSFANEKKQCFVFDKQDKRHFISNIEGVLAERYLYDFSMELLQDFPNVEEQAIEQLLGRTVDENWNKIVEAIENRTERFSPKYPGYFFDVYKCAVIQMLRTPLGKRQLLQIYKEVYGKDSNEDFENIVLGKEICDVLSEDTENVLLNLMLNEYGHIAIGINVSDIPFITSDTPVLVLPNIWDNSKSEMMMYYPITPKRCIFFLKRKTIEKQDSSVIADFKTGKLIIRDIFDIPQEAYRREKEIDKMRNPKTIELERGDVLICNSYCAKMATRYIVSSQSIKQVKLWETEEV